MSVPGMGRTVHSGKRYIRGKVFWGNGTFGRIAFGKTSFGGSVFGEKSDNQGRYRNRRSLECGLSNIEHSKPNERCHNLFSKKKVETHFQLCIPLEIVPILRDLKKVNFEND